MNPGDEKWPYVTAAGEHLPPTVPFHVGVDPALPRAERQVVLIVEKTGDEVRVVDVVNFRDHRVLDLLVQRARAVGDCAPTIPVYDASAAAREIADQLDGFLDRAPPDLDVAPSKPNRAQRRKAARNAAWWSRR